MARIIYAWELGGDYGHIGSFMPLALELRRQGHEVVFVIRDLTNAETVVSKYQFQVLQAPIWTANISGLPNPPLNYSEIIIRYGFINKVALSGLNRAWLGLFALLRPALVIADHSPVALFTARAIGLPRAVYGTGFCSPPHIHPMPNMRSWEKVPQKRLEDSDKHVLTIANSLLLDMKSPAPLLHSVADLFNVDEDFLCTFPEMDHYAQRTKVAYWGPVFNIEQGAEIDWPPLPAASAPQKAKSKSKPKLKPQAEPKRIFAYIKPGHRDYEKMLLALKNCGHSVLLFSPGISRNLISKYETEHFRITADPLKLGHILGQCDLGICHAGHGTMAALLLAGVPLLLLPTQLEQYLASARIQQFGAAEIINLEKNSKPDYAVQINRMLNTPSYKEKAQAFAALHPAFDQGKQFAAMANRINHILARSAAAKASKDAAPSRVSAVKKA